MMLLRYMAISRVWSNFRFVPGNQNEVELLLRSMRYEAALARNGNYFRPWRNDDAESLLKLPGYQAVWKTLHLLLEASY